MWVTGDATGKGFDFSRSPTFTTRVMSKILALTGSYFN